MAKRKVISGKNLAIRPPILLSVVLWLLLDRLAAPGWLFGVAGTVITVFWILFIVDALNHEDVDIF